MTVLAPTPPQPGGDDGYAAVRRQAIGYLLANHRDLLIHPGQHRAEIGQAITEAVAAGGNGDHPQSLNGSLESDLRNFILGAGDLQKHLDDPGTTEIMVNGSQVIVERGGLLCVEQGFATPDDAFRLAETMALRMGERFQLASPIVDFAWQDGSRVNLVHPILTGGKVAITIRKPDKSRPLDLGSLVATGTLSQEMADYLTSAIDDQRNIILAGAQASGKTTLLRAVMQHALAGIPLHRLIVIEDTPELNLDHPNTIALRAHRPAPGEQGARAVDLAELTRAAKRMRPDRLIVGEVRGPEGKDLIDAAQSESIGVITTVHLGKPEDLAGRFYYFGTLAGLGLSPSEMAAWVYSTFHVLAYLAKARDGRRLVTRIVRLDPDTQSMTDLFRYDPTTDSHIEVRP